MASYIYLVVEPPPQKPPAVGCRMFRFSVLAVILQTLLWVGAVALVWCRSLDLGIYHSCLLRAGSKGSVKIRDAAIVPPTVVLRGMLRVSDSLPRGLSRASIARGGMARLSTLRRPSAAAAVPSTGAAGSLPKQLVALDLATQPDRQVCLLLLLRL